MLLATFKIITQIESTFVRFLIFTPFIVYLYICIKKMKQKLTTIVYHLFLLEMVKFTAWTSYCDSVDSLVLTQYSCLFCL